MKNAYTVVKVGYNHFAFKSMETALEFYRMVASSIPVDTNYSDLPDGRKGIKYIRENLALELEQIDAKSIEADFTKAELKERAEANADIEGVVELIDVSDAPREIGFTEVLEA